MSTPGPPSGTPTPTAIGRFKVIETLGRGAQGVVYLARDPELDRLVAIKTLARGGDHEGRLRQEARSVGRLKHPNIVPLFEIGEPAGNPYLVYEHVDGRALRTLLDAEDPLPLERSVRWVQQILDAVGCAHEAGVVHRDLNPSNVLIDANGNARVMDFGLALGVGTRISPQAPLSGTARYMAPEQIRGEPAGPGADLFAAGLILYEALCGRHPVDARDSMSAMYRIAHEAIPSISTRAPQLAGAWDALLARALANDPADRFASAAALSDAIADVLAAAGYARDEPGAGSSSTVAFLLRRMRRRSDFPTMSDQIVEINRKTAHPDQTSVNELSNAILNDYGLTTKLLRLVNSSFYSQYGGRISTVSRAVVILGYKQVRLAAQSLLLFEHLASGARAEGLRDAAATAQIGGVLARSLADRIGLEEPEEAFVCAMLRNLGRFLTMYYLPEEFADIRTAMASQGLGERAACQRVLGLSYESLGVGIAREWQLPATIVESLRELPPGPGPAPREPDGRLRILAAFSSELAETLASGSAGRLAALQERFGAALPVDTASLRTLIADAVAAARSYGPILNDRLERSSAFRGLERWLGGDSPPVPAPGPHRSGSGADTAPGAPPDAPSTAVLNGLQDITDALIEGCSVNDVLIMILETLYRGLELSRVILCIQDRRRGEMAARFGLGKDLDTLQPRFRFRVAPADDAFSQAVLHFRDFVHPGPHAGPSNLPTWYRKLLNPAVVVILPIVVKGICFGVIYCDRDEGTAAPTDAHLNYLNTLRNHAALAIKQSA